MKKYFLSLLLFLAIGVMAQDDAYQSGDYQAAIAAYEARIASGEASGDLYYNLGNAYYQTGQLALALLNYRRAEIYLPRDEAVALQLARVRGERADTIGAETDWLVISANLSSDLFTIYELSIVVFVFWALFCFLLALSRPNLRWLVWLTALGMLIGFFFLGSRLYVDNQQPEAVMMVDASQIMSGPGDDYLPLAILYEAAEMRILEKRDDWYRFALADGRSGWIQAGDIALIGE